MGLNRIKRNKSDNYTHMCNLIMREKNISLKAKGLYAMVMSLPDEWVFSVDGMVAISKEESGAIYTAIKELISEGYCKRQMVVEKGRFVGCEYTFYEEKQKVETEEPHSEKPHRDFPHTENREENKLINKINNSSINTPINLNNKKRLSNDNQKVDELFDKFWEEYDYKKSKKDAIKAWDKLTDADKEIAIKAIPLYKQDCKHYQRSMQHPATYLNKRTFEDDFNIIPEYYQNDENDNSTEARYKRYMIKTFPNLIYHRNPLTFEQYMYFVEEYNESGRNYVNESLEKLNTMEINQFISIEQGLKRLLKESKEDRVYGDE